MFLLANCFLKFCSLGNTLLFQAYLDELVELHRRLMTLRERHILQQVRSAFGHNPYPQTSRPSLSWGVWQCLETTAASYHQSGHCACRDVRGYWGATGVPLGLTSTLRKSEHSWSYCQTQCSFLLALGTCAERRARGCRNSGDQASGFMGKQ